MRATVFLSQIPTEPLNRYERWKKFCVRLLLAGQARSTVKRRSSVSASDRVTVRRDDVLRVTQGTRVNRGQTKGVASETRGEGNRLDIVALCEF